MFCSLQFHPYDLIPRPLCFTFLLSVVCIKYRTPTSCTTVTLFPEFDCILGPLSCLFPSLQENRLPDPIECSSEVELPFTSVTTSDRLSPRPEAASSLNRCIVRRSRAMDPRTPIILGRSISPDQEHIPRERQAEEIGVGGHLPLLAKHAERR